MKKKNKKLTMATIVDALHQKVFEETGIKGKAKAGKAGNYFEATVSSLEKIGYPSFPFKDKENNNLPDCYIETNVPYCNILCQVANELLIEIDLSLPRKNIDIIFEEASQEIIDEYTDECIKHSFKYIISPNDEVLEQIKNSKLFHKRRKELGYVK